MKRACILVRVPIIVGTTFGLLDIVVVPGSLDLLLSRKTCSKLGLVLDLVKSKAWARGKSVKLVEHRAGHLMLNVLDLWNGDPSWKATGSQDLRSTEREVVLTAIPNEEEWDPLRGICQPCEECDSSTSVFKPTTFKEWFSGVRAPMTKAWKRSGQLTYLPCLLYTSDAADE